jgi:hypothetical protein
MSPRGRSLRRCARLIFTRHGRQVQVIRRFRCQRLGQLLWDWQLLSINLSICSIAASVIVNFPKTPRPCILVSRSYQWVSSLLPATNLGTSMLLGSAHDMSSIFITVGKVDLRDGDFISRSLCSTRSIRRAYFESVTLFQPLGL